MTSLFQRSDETWKHIFPLVPVSQASEGQYEEDCLLWQIPSPLVNELPEGLISDEM